MVVPLGLGRPAYADSAQYFYDPDGRLIGVVDPVKGSAQYTYDATGNILSVTTNPITSLVVVQFSPAVGPAGTLVTIAGTGFGTTANTSVKFNGRAAQPTAVTATSITVRVPAGATSGPISVTKTSTGTVTTATSYTVQNAATGPTLTNFSPTQIQAGSTITLTGTNFDPVNSQVLVNGRLVQINSATATSITATVPTLSSGHVTVMTPNGQAASSSDLVVTPSLFGGVSASQRVTLPGMGASGMSVSAAVSSTSQASLVMFDATAGQRISTMQSGTAFAVRLYAPDGSRVLPVIFASQGIPPFFATNAPLPLTGTYVLALSSPDGTTTGTANFMLYNVPPDITGTIAANGTLTTTNITTPGQAVDLTFNGTAGQRLNLLTGFGTNPSSEMQVMTYEPDGATLLYFADLESNSQNPNNAYSDVRVLPTTGTYTFRFVPSSFFAGAEPGTVAQVPTLTGSTGPLTTTLFNVPPDINGQIPSGGGTVTASTTVPGQTINETFAGQAGQTVFLGAQLEGGFLNDPRNCSKVIFAAVNPDGSHLYTAAQSLTAGAPTNNSGPLTLQQSGTFTFSFDPTVQQPLCGTPPFTGSVGISVNIAPAPLNGGTLVAGGSPVTATTAAPGQGATFTFAGTAGQLVQLLTTPAAAFSQNGATYNISVSGPSGSFYSRTTGASADTSGFMSLPSTGTYTVQFTPQVPAPDGAITLQLEVPLSGTLVAGGSPLAASVTAPGDQVIASFAGTAGEAVELVTQMSAAFGSGYQLQILPPGDAPDQSLSVNPLYTNTLDTVPNDTGFLILPQTGTYYAVFTPSQPTTGSVTMALSAVPAGSLGIGGVPVTASTTTANQIVTLNFSGTSGQQVVLTAQPATAFDAAGYALTITDPDGQTLLYSGRSTAPVLSSGTLTLPSTGSYTVQFLPQGSATGAVVLQLGVPSQQMLTAGGAPVTVTVATAGTVVGASFSGSSGQFVTLVTTPGSAFNGQGYTLSILDPDGQTTLYATAVASQSAASPALPSGALMLTQNGTYTVEFAPTGSGVGPVTLQLETPVNGGTVTLEGAPLTVSAAQPGDAVQFTLSGSGGSPAQLLIQPDPLLANPTYTVTIYDPFGNLVTTESPPPGPALLQPFSISNFGFDTVLVSPGAAATAQIAATLFEPGSLPYGAFGLNATVATPGATGQAQICCNVAGDVLALLTQADTTLRQACFTVTVLEPDGQTALYSHQQSSATDFSPALVLPTPGTYTVEVTSCGSATGNAALTVYNVPANAPGSVTIGGTASAVQILVPAQDAQITFPTGTANQTAKIALTADASFSSACYSVTVTDPNNNVVNTGQGCGTSYTSSVLTLPAIGTYTVTVASVSTAVGTVTIGVTAQ